MTADPTTHQDTSMDMDLSEEAAEYGRTARRAFEAAGGDDLVQAAEADPGQRAALVEPVLADLGAFDLAPHDGPDEVEAAAALCRAAGWFALPYPLAERLNRPADADGLLVVADVNPAAAVQGLDLRWSAVDLDGRHGRATPRPATETPRKSAFVVGLDIAELTDHQAAAPNADALPLGLTLPCFTLLGMLDRAMDLTRTHVLDREQFGQPLAKFQGVQFQYTDAEVERAGLDALAAYTLWSIQTHRPEALDDALALRLAALEAAETVFRITHQLHGATGFCDEAPLSWLSRHSQPLRRLPFGPAAARTLLARRIGARGLTGIFGPTTAEKATA